MERSLDPEVLSDWIGRRQTTSDVISAHWVAFLADTLGAALPIALGESLPALWHWIFFLESAPLDTLGRDGHPETGGFLPPVALPRRMWAGGRFEFFEPLIVGEAAVRESSIRDVTVKDGRSGSLVFVTVRHEISAAGSLRLIEEHDIVYREMTGAVADPLPPPPDPEWSEKVTPSEVMLFRYSALTFNGHRIHYDRTYCREVEGYPGLVVHGPLTATLLAGLAERSTGSALRTFNFRAMAPLFDIDPFEIRGRVTPDGADLWAESPDGGLAMHAEATFF